MENSAHPQSAPNPAGKGVEASDISVKRVLIVLGVFVAVGVAIHLIVGWQIIHYLKSHQEADSQARKQEVLPQVTASRQRWPEPRLQISPVTDLREFRAREDAELNSYGWINKTAGVVRIPIERAMDLVLKKGLPARTGTNEIKTSGSSLQYIQKRRGEYVPPQGQGGKQ
jgi:hypothetical protein